MPYTFTPGCDLFGTCELRNAIEQNYFDKKNIYKILEIGSYEGSSSVCFSDHLLNHPDSTLTCVDPFLEDDTTTRIEDGNFTKKLFLDNICKSKNGHKVTLKQMYSSDFYKQNDKTYNLIYIDGSHLVPDIQVDFVNCVKILEKGGVMWMDDYLWGDGHTIRDAINKLFIEHRNKLEIIHKGYQIGFRKVDM